MRQLSRKFLIDFAPAKLWRFCRNEQRLEGFLGILLKQFRELSPHFFRIHISHHDERKVVRNVAGFVILHHLLLGELVIDLKLADYRESIWVPLVSGGKKK